MLFNRALTAIDIGSRTLKGLQLVKNGGEICVKKYFFHDMAAGNELYPLESSFHEAFKTLIESNQLKKSRVITALQDSEIITHDVTLPQMPAKDLDLAIYNDIETNLNLSREAACLDYVYLEKAEAHKQTQNLIKTYCAKRESILSVLENLKFVDLKPVYIDSEVLARVAMLAFNSYIAENKNYVTIEFGESHTSVALISNYKVLMNSVLPSGLGSINKILFETSGMLYEDAEKLKKSYDLSSDEPHPQGVDYAMLDDHFDQNFYKIRRLIEVFKVQLKSAPISSILVTGGGSQLCHLDKALESFLGLPVELVNPFRKIKIYNEKENRNDTLARLAPHMATVIGLALREIA